MNGAQLKNIRLSRGIGSKWLKHAIATKHPVVLQHRNFVHDVEYGRLEATPEVIETWKEMCTTVLPPKMDNPCDTCGLPTSSWLYDNCIGCMTSMMTQIANKHLVCTKP